MTRRPALPYVGSRIRTARLAKGLRQEDLASVSGVSRPQIANIESGRGDPSLSAFVALCEAVGMEPSYALRPTACQQCGDEPPPGFTCDACGAPRGSAGSS